MNTTRSTAQVIANTWAQLDTMHETLANILEDLTATTGREFQDTDTAVQTSIYELKDKLCYIYGIVSLEMGKR